MASLEAVTKTPESSCFRKVSEGWRVGTHVLSARGGSGQDSEKPRWGKLSAFTSSDGSEDHLLGNGAGCRVQGNSGRRWQLPFSLCAWHRAIELVEKGFTFHLPGLSLEERAGTRPGKSRGANCPLA